MGCFFMSKSSYDPYEAAKANKYKDEKPQEVYTDLERKANPNPDPERFTIFKHLPVGDYLIACIKYHDCTNYEGTKVLVFEDLTYEKLRSFRSIDPHFSENKKYKSPIARFVPTNQGWDMARAFCLAMMADKERPSIKI